MRSAYFASKAGVIGLTKSLGQELADTGIRVNCVTPAAVEDAIYSTQMTQQQIDWMLSKISDRRFGEIDEVASLVLWLASDECSLLHRRGIRHLRRPRDVLMERLKMDSETIGLTPATEWAAKFRAKQMSPVEAMRALLDRITALEPKVNAFAYLAADQAMDAARAAEKALMGGEKTRPAARRAGDDQGSRLAKDMPTHKRQSEFERLSTGRGYACRAAVEGRGRDHPWQDHDIGVRLERRVGKSVDRHHA